jgi:hypothetical protein
MQIEITDKVSKEHDFIPVQILKELFKGTSINLVLKHVHILLSRFNANIICKGSKKRILIETNTQKMINRLSSVFYILIDIGVIKVSRFEDNYEILYNGEYLNF